MFPWINERGFSPGIEPIHNKWQDARNYAVGLLEKSVKEMYGFSDGAWDDVRKSGRLRVEVEVTRGTRQSEERYYLDDKMVGYIHAVVAGGEVRVEAFSAKPEDQIDFDPTGVKYAPTREETMDEYLRGENADGKIKNIEPVIHRKRGKFVEAEKVLTNDGEENKIIH
jgi:hypothetical protein